ncbi:MAG: F0F1 ATP synthase subunit epsilon [Deltaproteobacteria bacterium]|nr:F0F1 ATP synthase subunit epsilon [Deltaproteobacteria bacterium]
MKLKLITPQIQLFEGEVDAVTLPGSEGEFQVLPGHTYFLTLLQTGEMSYETGHQTTRFQIGEGHAEVHDEVVTVAVDHAQALE